MKKRSNVHVLSARMKFFQEAETVWVHLYRNGFIDNYYHWVAHGEPPLVQVHAREGSSGSHNHDLNFFGLE